MPTIHREDISAVDVVVSIDITPADYLPKLKQKLRDVQKRGDFKGFRPGQVPMPYLRNKFGYSILFEIVEEEVKKSLSDYMRDEKLAVVGQPFPHVSNSHKYSVEDETKVYTFKFDLGLVPAFEVKGADFDNILPFYDIAIDEEFLQGEIERLRERFAAGFDDAATEVDEKDIVYVTLAELDTNGELKARGVTRVGAPFLVKDLNEALRSQLLGKTVGESVDFNIYEAELRRSKEFVEKNFLQISPKIVCGKNFRFTIERINRPKKAELGDDFYRRLFPNDEVNDVDMFQDKMRTELHKVYKQLSTQRFMATIHDSLLEQNDFELPMNFLRKFITATNANLPEVYFESAEFGKVVRDLRWEILSQRLAKMLEIEITEEDVEDSLRFEIVRYYQYQLHPYSEQVNNMIKDILTRKGEYAARYKAALEERVLETLTERVGKDVKSISKAEFDALDAPAPKTAIAETVDATTEEASAE